MVKIFTCLFYLSLFSLNTLSHHHEPPTTASQTDSSTPETLEEIDDQLEIAQAQLMEKLRPLFIMAKLNMSRGNIDEAERDLKFIVEKSPEWEEARLSLFTLLINNRIPALGLGDDKKALYNTLKEARSHIERLVLISKDNEEYKKQLISVMKELLPLERQYGSEFSPQILENEIRRLENK